MADSPLFDTMKVDDSVVQLPSMVIKIESSTTSRTSIDLATLKHIGCDTANPRANRDKQIDKLAEYFNEINGSSSATAVNTFSCFKAYLCVVDNAGLDPFCKDGLVIFSRYLWRKVQIFDPLKKLWDFNHGDELGLKECSAAGMLNVVIVVLKEVLGGNADIDLWLRKEKSMSANVGIDSNESYEGDELNLSVKRLTLYFTHLAKKLIRFHRSGEVEETIKVSIDGVDWLVPVTVDACKKMCAAGATITDSSVLTSRAFNQAMIAGYYLLSYFTAFNTSVSLNVRRPLTLTETQAEEWYELTAFKGRSVKDVEALVGGKAHKKALEFMKLIVTLSEEYNQEEHGLLVYQLTNVDKPKALAPNHMKNATVNEVLDLTTSNRSQCVNHLCRIYTKLLDTYHATDYSLPVYRVRDNKVCIDTKVSKQGIENRISTLAFTIIDAIKLDDSALVGIVLPLGFEDRDDKTILTFRYIDGRQGSMSIPAKYKWVIERQLEFAISKTRIQHFGAKFDYSKMRKSKNRFNSILIGYNPMYFIPFGNWQHGFKQWTGLSPLLTTVLSDFGVGLGEYRLNLTSSRFRETNAQLIRSRKGNTINDTARILQNLTTTVLKNYGEDSKEHNLIVMSQSIQVIEVLVTDEDNNGDITKEAVNRAKQQIKDTLKIEVLEYDKYLELGRKQNGIGIYCGDPHDELMTRKAKRIAETASLLNKGEVLSCHEYLDCIGCPKSKLINDVSAIYRLLSFINMLEEFRIFHVTEEQYLLNFGDVVEVIKYVVHEVIPRSTIEDAEQVLEEHGRHPLWDDLTLVGQFVA